MKKTIFQLATAAIILGYIPAASAIFNSCSDASGEPKPDWVSKPDYSIPNQYVGVGTAENSGRTREEQARYAEDMAKSQLVQRIEVTIRSDVSQTTRLNSQGVLQDVQNTLQATAEQVLRGLKVRDRWIDTDCTYYTLVMVSEQSVEQTRREKLMKQRMERFKLTLADGSDRSRNRDIKLRRQYLDEAKALLSEIDFRQLPEELNKDIYAQRLSEAVAALGKEESQVKDRVALVAINADGKIRSDVMGKLLDFLRNGIPGADRLLDECKHKDDCISRARERGFTKLALLKASNRIETSQMGALKGMLIVQRTLYDIESQRVLKDDTVTAQVIGWSNEELDWHAAADKAMQALK